MMPISIKTIGRGLSLCLLTILGGCINQMTGEQSVSQFQSMDSSRQMESYPLLVAADRGFWGNEQLREAATLAGLSEANLLILHHKNLQKRLADKFASLPEDRSILLLPYFLSADHSLWQKTRQRLIKQFITEGRCSKRQCQSVSFARPLGESYIAQEALVRKLAESLQNRSNEARSVVLLMDGAENRPQAERISAAMKRRLQPVAREVSADLKQVFVWRNQRSAYQQQIAALTRLIKEENASLIPWHLGRKLDSMMGLNAWLSHSISGFTDSEPLTTEMAATWIRRQINRASVASKKNTGVIFLAHGSDIDWNDRMRAASRQFAKQQDTEYVFSMADQSTIERAIRRFEKKNIRHVVIIRVFGQSSSFRDKINRMFGLEDRANQAASTAGQSTVRHGHHHGHRSDHSPRRYQSPRIITSLDVISTGGLDDNPLFARALLDKALAISNNPKQEALLLAAHGKGQDEENEIWRQQLEQLAAFIKQSPDYQFTEIATVTWREDWADKKHHGIEKARQFIRKARAKGLRVIIVPARTTGQGPAKDFLKGEDFELATGFAPHPLFETWLLQQYELGLDRLKKARQDLALLPSQALRQELQIASRNARENAGNEISQRH